MTDALHNPTVAGLASQRRTFVAPSALVATSRPTRIRVIGAGGTGGEVVDHLCRLDATLRALGHPGLSVTLYDGDDVSESNIGRQRFSPAEVGHNKAVCLIHRINLFYGLDWEAVPFDFDVNESLCCDLVITATDSAAFRQALADRFRDDGWHHYCAPLWLDFGNGASDGQAILGHLFEARSSEYLPNVIDLYPDMVDDPNDGPSCSVAEAIRKQAFGVNAALVSQAFASLIWPLFRQGRIDRHGLFMDVATGVVQPLHIDPLEWSMFGYTPERDTASDAA